MDIPCPHCGQPNESRRETCLACFKPLSGSLFKITRNQSTKITVNGKDYARLEDVPEPFRSMLKDSDGDGMPDIANKGKATWKILPSIKIDFGPDTEPLALDPNVPVELPARFRLDSGGKRLVSWRLFSWSAVASLLFMTLFNGIMASMFYFAFFYSSKSDDLPWLGLLGLLSVAALGAYGLYRAIVHVVDRATLGVDAARVSVELGPLPWFGARDVPKAEIATVFSVKVTERYPDSDSPRWPDYRVRLVLKDGRTIDLATELRAPEEAMFIEQQIRRP